MSFFDRYLKKNNSTVDLTKSDTNNPIRQKLPWIEKYRPKTLSDISSQTETIKTLENSMLNHNLPHLLFHGSPGTGKTSTILAICRQLYKTEYRNFVLELNASDERGINVVRGKIKAFAQGKTTIRGDIPPYKIIILDEADSMTREAQSALRRMIEDYSKVTRFCLICNHLNRIIEPLASRCAKFRFKTLPKSEMKHKLEEISIAEGINWSDELGDVLYEISKGDLRMSINLLQCIHDQFGTMVSLETVKEIAGVVDNSIIQKLINAIYDNNFSKLKEEIDDVISEGYTATQILEQFNQWVTAEEDLNDMEKSYIVQKMAETDKSLSEGSNESLQLYDLFGYCMTLINKKIEE
jgi:replication factor C subunit 2/4